jgi:lysophospholipase L1-like esterase
VTSGASLTVAVALVLAAGLVPIAAAAGPADCAAPAALTAIPAPLDRIATRLEAQLPVLIVAVGSSSTAGTGASGAEETYPSRLQAELRQRFPRADLTVLNRGKGGEDAGEELARLDRDVVAAHPDLVIWQLGTNAVLRRDDLAADAEMIERGVDTLKSDGIDVVLMDMQYAPRVLNRPAYPAMEQLIADAAQRDGVGLYRRFDVMHYWQEGERFAQGMTAADGLHMTDLSYHCLAASLADALSANWAAHAKGERRAPAAPAAVAGLAPR